MITLLAEGRYELFVLLIAAIVMSLSFHEFGHAIVAKWNGDDTAQRAGRLTLNPLAHVDVFGLLMVVVVGFGYAKPVPTNPNNFQSRYSDLWVSAAGPFMNLVLAVICINTLAYLLLSEEPVNQGVLLFLSILSSINLLLMVFNLMPIGPLDGHYILPYFLPERLASKYIELNHRFGTMVLLGLIVLAIMGLPIFTALFRFSNALMPYLTFISN